jgi:hypothetical protein
LMVHAEPEAGRHQAFRQTGRCYTAERVYEAHLRAPCRAGRAISANQVRAHAAQSVAIKGGRTQRNQCQSREGARSAISRNQGSQSQGGNQSCETPTVAFKHTSAETLTCAPCRAAAHEVSTEVGRRSGKRMGITCMHLGVQSACHSSGAREADVRASAGASPSAGLVV